MIRAHPNSCRSTQFQRIQYHILKMLLKEIYAGKAQIRRHLQLNTAVARGFRF